MFQVVKMGILNLMMMFHIFQWNTRSLIANGQELKGFIGAFKETHVLKMVCIQETWLKPCLDFVIPGYFCLRKDRNSSGGGCATFISQDVQYRRVNITVELDCVVVEVWTTTGRLTVVNLYNPCLSLDVAELDQVMKQVRPLVVWTGDFNAHNPLWGSEKRDLNGSVLKILWINLI